jgi:hypothetical protein
LGAVIGVAAVLSNLLKQRRELSSLKREIRLKNKLAVMDESHSPIQPS